MKLVVGLGNPGKKYEGTRHNIGFDVLAELCRRVGSPSAKTRFQGELYEGKLNDQSLLLLAPITFMNLSGASVQPTADFFKLAPTDILVICDDMNLPLGKLRIRAKGSAGGQKGLADIIRRLGTDEVPRLRIGIDRPPDRWDPADYVLSKFKKVELEPIQHAIVCAADAVELWAKEGTEASMNQYNGQEK